MKQAAIVVGGIIALVLVGTVANRYLSPFREETRRLTHHQSVAYNEGMALNLDRLCREIDEPGVAASIRLQAAHFTGDLPPHISQCIAKARSQ